MAAVIQGHCVYRLVFVACLFRVGGFREKICIVMQTGYVQTGYSHKMFPKLSTLLFSHDYVHGGRLCVCVSAYSRFE